MKPISHRLRDLLDDETDAGGLRLQRQEALPIAAFGQGEAAWPTLLFTHPVLPQAVAPSLAPVVQPLAGVVQPLAGAAPVASNSSAAGFRNAALNGVLKASDAEGDALSYTLLTQPAQGSVVHNGSGSFTYTPPNGFSGTTSFTFRASDGVTNSNTATVTITVSNTTAPAITEADLHAEPYSNDLRADALLDFAPGWNLFARLPYIVGNVTLRQPTPKLYYTFDTTYSAGSASSSGRTGAVVAFNPTQQDAATAILLYVSTVTGIPFELTDNASNADIHFAAANVDFRPDDADDTIAGICLYDWNWSTLGGSVSSFNANSIVLLDNLQFAAENAAPAPGNDGYQILLHEIGHALGLDHPFANPDPSKRLAPANDNTDNTVMSYTWTGANKSIFQSYDLLALRWIYGEDGLAGTWGFNSFYGPSLTLSAPNSAPMASNTSVNATEDQTLNGQLPAATDIDGHAVTYSRVSNATHGSATVNANGSFSYVPAANFNGGDSFSFRVTDTEGAFNTYTVTVSVAAVNDAPLLAQPLADQSAIAGTAFGFGFAANSFTDVDGQPLAYTAQLEAGGALPAWLTFTPGTRSFAGTPQQANVGTLNVRVTASDGSLSASDVFTITVAAAPNQAPTAANVTVNATEDQTLNGNLPAATDANGDPVSYALASNAAHGTAVVTANGGFSYAPERDFHGSDGFTYRVSDAQGASNTYTVTVTVAAVNDAPVVHASSASTPEDQPLEGGMSADDDESPLLQFSVDSAPAHGTLVMQSSGAWRYLPAANYHGGDSFTVRASDGALSSAPATVSLTITPVNDAPVASGANVTTAEDTPLDGAFVAGDVDGTQPFIIVITPPEHGTLELLDGLNYRYRPAPEFSGSDSLRFIARDGLLDSAIVTQSISVTPVNDAPRVPGNVNAHAVEDQLATGTLTADDPDSTTITFELITPPAHGTLQLLPSGQWSYAPDANFASTDGFTYRASDGLSSSPIGQVSFTVQNVNDLATGGLAVVGEALVGRMLEVVSSLRDIDGLGTFAYRWLRVLSNGQTETAGTGAGYVPTAADVGRTLRAEVSFIDARGSEERAASALFGPIADAATTSGSAAGERLTGAALPDLLDGGDGNDTLAGGGGNDTLMGGTGNDSADGGAGFDTLSYQGRSGALVAALGSGTASIGSEFDLFAGIEALIGGLGHDQLDGDGQANRLDGGAGNDSIHGGAGDDTLAAGSGNDTLDGGAGSDTADYDGVLGALRIDLAGGSTTGTGKSDTLRAIEHARGGWGDDTLLSGAGSQRLDGHYGDDSISAGDGDDVLIGGLGRDTLDGGSGWDVVIYRGEPSVNVDLSSGVGRQQGDDDLLTGIEAAVSGAGDDFLVGRDDAGQGLGQVFRSGAGNDTLDGRGGVDQAQFGFPYAEYQVVRQGNEIAVGHIPSIQNQPGGDGLDTLVNIERLLFADRYVAFGARAEEVARVAFVLWSPAIAFSTTLFARGISYYDVGYDFRTLVETALLFHPDSDADLAAKLVLHTPGTTKTAAQLLALMQAQGGGSAGRIAAVSEMASDPKTVEQVALAGFVTHGIPCELSVFDTLLFAQLPGG